MAESLREVLEGQQWNKALFTTYTLSLTFFESIILRALRAADCDDIWVIADADGYRSSLMERGASGVGYEYRLIPVGLRRGVFHPKCCYLAGTDGDLLLVGSGNLTFGGFGRNLEVLESLSSNLHQQCFTTFADFLTGLKARPDVVCPDFEWVNLFAKRAREVSAVGEAAEFPKLLTSLDSSLKSQLATEVSSLGGSEHVTILSPFYDPDGRAVLELAEETKAREVRIGLPPGTEQSCFPFTKAKRWAVTVSAVKLSAKDENRRLHAKLIEWKTNDGILTLTGSINATRQALSDINNIEVGVLRLAPRGWAEWSKVTNPSFCPTPAYKRSGIGNSYLVFAELVDSGDLRGRIVSISSPAGEWFGDIQKANGDSIHFTVAVSGNGYFTKSHLTGDEDFLFASGLQIKLESGSRTARGWLTNNFLLNLPKSHRISPSALLRLINREETEDDDAALLEYLAIYALDHLNTFQARAIALKETTEDTGRNETFSIDLEYLKPDSTAVAQDYGSEDSAMSAALAIERVFAQLRRRLLGHISRKESSQPGPVLDPSAGSGEDEDEDPTKERTRSTQRFDNAFEYFMGKMEELAKDEALSAEHRRPALVIWVEIALHMLVRRKRDRDEAKDFLLTWFWLTTTMMSAKEISDSLEQHVVTSAAILAGANLESKKSVLSLHEALEHFWGGNVDLDRAIDDLLPPSPLSISQLFLESSPITLEESLKTVLSTTTLRHELDRLLKGEELNTGSPLLQNVAGIELRDELKARGKNARIEFLSDRSFLCPKEFIVLSEACKGELQRNRVARCSVCGRLILRTRP
jgi:hypothetical protein